ncbi:10391_t:CDS:2 [Paraglomus brasilianum]|uniref:10391_t:CDS:1 n=1 Tax=Paraglomus brasilianum TaxID=144538 RepID=A0A9N9CLX9_9GLOM|nr:10391_t:CDS:2 [Paraglomus brasilianum]
MEDFEKLPQNLKTQENFERLLELERLRLQQVDRVKQPFKEVTDNSRIICEALVKPFNMIPTNTSELKFIMKSDLLTSLPVAGAKLLALKNPQVRNIFDYDEVNCQCPLGVQFGSALSYTNQRNNTQEDMMHFMMDSLIRAPVEEISRVLHLPVTVDRNATDSGSTTVEQCHPDFLFRIKDVLFFWGEEKSVTGAFEDLEYKFTQFDEVLPEELKFMICYTANGTNISFYIIDGWTKRKKDRFVPFTKEFNLNDIQDRIDILKAIINITRLVRTLVDKNCIPSAVYPVTKTQKYHRSTISYEANYVKKVVSIRDLPFVDGENLKMIESRVDFLFAMYQHAKGKRGLVQVKDGPKLIWGNTAYKIKLATRGIAVETLSIHSEDKVQKLVLDVVTGLSYLHSGGYLHCDVRLPNIVYDSTLKQYVLIDFEHGGRRDDVNISKRKSRNRSKHVVRDRHYRLDIERLKDWDDNTLDNGVYTKRSEMYQFGILLHTTFDRVIRSKNGKDFVEKLRAKQLTAADALKHLWLR